MYTKLSKLEDWSSVRYELWSKTWDALPINSRYIKDLSAIFANFDTMVKEVSQTIPEVNRTKNKRLYEEKLEKLNQSLKDWEEQLLILALGL
jgi:hypothetical protein